MVPVALSPNRQLPALTARVFLQDHYKVFTLYGKVE
jgi:hypothetical protein